ncbi:SixA phosphatase family protein [Salinimicrobium oceani]|uniref:Histidine phosphatase family protein n=1 Tax=Salinimicrobium oceani TaxID=2722702 RepID=A0ABX1CWB3_9FLAO|nr:histidine phosphatase family protein [Salinimicrobium oceani]NJW52581.1 histidine phosphatase family protein [Salinimicrobium oceani]
MKKLILVRHGKSSWVDDLPDVERPLKKRAYKDATLVINAFSEFVPEEIQLWSSPAVRAATTARYFQEELEIPEARFQIKKDLYTFDRNALLKMIGSCDQAVENLMIFGHNPAMTGVANTLGDQNFSNIPTTGLCMIQFETNDWSSVKNGKTLLYLFPKNLR